MKQVSIIGLGLIGGSLGLALKQAGQGDIRIVGYTRTSESAAMALKVGAVDKIADSPALAVDQADLVVLATPILAMKDILQQIVSCLRPGCIVTDTASTKAKVMQWAAELLPQGIDFIGGHPMAGKELSGVMAAEATLFSGCTYCLVPGASASSKSVQWMADLVKKMGATPLFISAAEHDDCVAGISHLPFLVSVALVTATTKGKMWESMSRLAASGYRDTTRLASQSPEMCRDICASNQENIIRWIDKFITELSELRHTIVANPISIDKVLVEARQTRQRWLEEYDKES